MADYFRESDMTYGMAELIFPAVVKPQRDKTAASPSPTTFGEHMQTLAFVLGQSLMLQETSQLGSSHIRSGSERPQSHKWLASLPPVTSCNMTHIKQ